MTQTAISVENLSKRFLIGAAEERASTFYDAIVSTFSSPLKRFRKLSLKASDEDIFWALQNINFRVNKGEVVGLIGHNGAGKSTLLKILSRITEPTQGRIEIRGRVASLLEVGTGFHPELTGRENIYLNGSILGMSREEIEDKFDAIVEFSGIERFLDTPFKRYSSGMGVRLAFAVAAHLDPEILVIDEVLAVGDAEFQKKCLGKMSEVAGSGRTVLFVSHNMSAVENLCDRAILLNRGEITADGPAKEVVDEYLFGLTAESEGGAELPVRNGIRLKVNIQGVEEDLCKPNEPVEFQLELESEKPLADVHAEIGIEDQRGTRITTLFTYLQTKESYQLQKSAKFTARWENLNLAPNTYWLTIVMLDSEHRTTHWERSVSFVVSQGDYYGTGRLPNPGYHGSVMVPVTWSVETD